MTNVRDLKVMSGKYQNLHVCKKLFMRWNKLTLVVVIDIRKRLRWYPSSRVQARPKPSDFSGEKILSAPSLGGEVKPSVPCRKFTACKRTQNWRGSRHFRQNSRQFLAHSSTFRCWGSLASFQTLGTPCGESWNVLITGPPSWGFDVLLATALCKTFLLRILIDSWAGQTPQGLQRRLKKKKKNRHT